MNKKILLFTNLVIILIASDISLYGAMSKKEMAEKKIDG